MPLTPIQAALGDPAAIDKLMLRFAQILQQSGNATGYSSANPTGAGVAGGRGGIDELKQQIRTSQIHDKVQKSVIKNYKELSDLLKSNNKTIKNVTSDLDVFSKVFTGKWTDVLTKISKSSATEQVLIKNLNKAMGGNITTLEDVLTLREDMLELEKKIQAAKGRESVFLTHNINQHRKISEAFNEATANLEDWGTRLESTGDVLRGSLNTFFSYRAAIANLSIAIVQLTNDFRAQLKYGSQLGIFETQMAAISKGIDPGALSAMLGEARQVSIAFGDVGEFSDLLTKEQRKYNRMIGETTASHQFVTDSFRMLGKAGIKPVAGAMDSLGHSFAFLNQAAGVTSEQFTTLMEGMLQDTDISEQLRAAKEGERGAIVAGIAKQVEMNVAMGMSTEQAFGAAKALGKIAGETAKDRFKRAAQVQMVMGAMGIAGGGRAGELIRMGARIDLVEGGRAELQGYMSQVADAAVTSKRGMIHQEIVYDRLLKDLPEMGKGSDFVTTTASALKPQKEQLDKLHFEAERGSSTLENMLLSVDIIKNFLVAGALGKMFAGGIQLLGTYLITKAAVGGLGGLGAAGAGGKLMSGLGVAGKFAKGAITRLALPLTLAATAYKGYKFYTDEKVRDETTQSWGRFMTKIEATWSDDAAYRLQQMDESEGRTQERDEQLLAPTHTTAENSTKQLSVQEKQLEVMITTYELQVGSVSNEKARIRIGNMDNQASVV